MLLELRFSVWTLGLGAGTFIAALYGMNLKNFIEESDFGFWGVSAICAVGSVVVLAYGLNRLRRVQRVSMWGDHCGPLPNSRNPMLNAQQMMLQHMRESLPAEERAGMWGASSQTAANTKTKRPSDLAREAGAQSQGPPWQKNHHPYSQRPPHSYENFSDENNSSQKPPSG
jgi:hypothetical protein